MSGGCLEVGMIKPEYARGLIQRMPDPSATMIVAQIGAGGMTITQEILDRMIEDFIATGKAGIWVNDPRFARRVSLDEDGNLQIDQVQIKD